MDGFSEKLHQQVEASLRANESAGRQSLMMQHMMMLQKKKDEEALILNQILQEEEQRREIEEIEEKKRRKKDKKKKKKAEKKQRKKEKKKRRQESSSSSDSESSDSDIDPNKDPIKAALALEKKKLEELNRKKEDKKSRSDAKRRKREEEAALELEYWEEQRDQERLREWQEAELFKKYSELSIEMIEGPIESLKVEEPVRERIPLRFFARNKMVAWEYPAPGGLGTSFAPLIGAPAREGDSDDEW
jgi:hypothetical protein